MGVWVGFDAERSLGEYTGGRAAAPIWTAFMERALEDGPVRDFTKPDDVTLVRVDTATGLLAVEGRASRMEPFVAGTEPKRSAPPLVEPEEEGADTGQDGYVEVGSDPSQHPVP